MKTSIHNDIILTIVINFLNCDIYVIIYIKRIKWYMEMFPQYMGARKSHFVACEE